MKDETYILNLCDQLLMTESSRQHKFEFLKGDGQKPRCLPVDAYYEKLSLVIEYHEKQHTEIVAFFDRRNTVSGVSRGEQRKIYDKRRRDLLPGHSIDLVEFRYSEFPHHKNKKLKKIIEIDEAVIKNKIEKYINKIKAR